MKNYKSKKIFKIINNSNKYLNLHEIKNKTGAGNGYKNYIEVATSNNSYMTETVVHKSHIINSVLLNSNKKLNLHEIKAQTGAGNGHKYYC